MKIKKNSLFLYIQSKLPITRFALVPPNPKEFESTYLIFLLFAFKGTKSKPVVSLSGFFKLFVGGAI